MATEESGSWVITETRQPWTSTSERLCHQVRRGWRVNRERLGLRAPRGRLSAGATGLASLASRALFALFLLFSLFIETPGTRRSIGRNFVHDLRRLQLTGCGSRRNYFGGWVVARLRASVPPSHAMGMYATTRSSVMNQAGAGIMKHMAMPASKKMPPITYAGPMRRFADSATATVAPARVPSACARNGGAKCLG